MSVWGSTACGFAKACPAGFVARWLDQNPWPPDQGSGDSHRVIILNCSNLDAQNYPRDGQNLTRCFYAAINEKPSSLGTDLSFFVHDGPCSEVRQTLSRRA